MKAAIEALERAHHNLARALAEPPDPRGETQTMVFACTEIESALAELRGHQCIPREHGIAACMRLNAELTDRVGELMEALAPFANRTAEKAQGGKYSALTDAQWRRALETYQTCPGGDMCGCEPGASMRPDPRQRIARLEEALKDHSLAVENLRRKIAEVYPAANVHTEPGESIRSHMAAVLRSLEVVRDALEGKMKTAIEALERAFLANEPQREAVSCCGHASDCAVHNAPAPAMEARERIARLEEALRKIGNNASVLSGGSRLLHGNSDLYGDTGHFYRGYNAGINAQHKELAQIAAAALEGK